MLLGASILVSGVGWYERGTVRMDHPSSFPWAPRAEQKFLLLGSLWRWYKGLIMIQICYDPEFIQGEQRRVHPAWQSWRKLCCALTHESFKGMKSLRSPGKGNIGRRRQGNINGPERKMSMPQGSSWGAKTFKSNWIFGGKTLNAYKVASREARISLRKPWDLWTVTKG